MLESPATLVLAAAGGYAFTLNYFPTHHRTLRSSGYALFYRSVFWGYVFFHWACLLIEISKRDGWTLHALSFWFDRSNWVDMPSFGYVIFDPLVQNSGSYTIPSILALWIGLTISLPLNALVTQKRKATIVAGQSTELELLLTSSLVNRRMLLVTLDSRKVYAGWVIKTLDIADNNADPGSGFKLLAFKSGYRCEETQEVFFTTDYEWLFDEHQDLSVDHLATFIPLHRVVSITNFDDQLFDDFAKHSAAMLPRPTPKTHRIAIVETEPTTPPVGRDKDSMSLPPWLRRLRESKQRRAGKPSKKW